MTLTKKTFYSLLFITLLLTNISCSVHKNANIKASEEFIVELEKPKSRGGAIDIALQGLFLGAKYLAENTSKSLTSSYTKSISINDYYNTDIGKIEKTYKFIHIKKYAKPNNTEVKTTLSEQLKNQFTSDNNTRGTAGSLTIKDVIREDKDDLLNFHTVIELISDPENPSITRLSFNQLRILFSKTRIFKDENLNAKISISIEGQWRSTDGSPMKKTLIEQEYDFKNLKYGYQNQISEPILSPWYYDIPITSEIEENNKYGVLNILISVDEYEGGKSKYIKKLPGILNDNKTSIIKNGSSTIQKVIKK